MSETPHPPDFEAIFDQELDYVVHSLRRLGVREADLEDVAQEVFMAVHRRLAEYRRDRPLRPWLFAFACRTAANYRRSAAVRRERAEIPPHLESEGPDPERALEQAWRSEQVHRVLGSIDFDRRVVLVMHDLDGFTAPEIASALEIPLNTVYTRVRLAREDFRTIAKRVLRERGTP